MALGHQYRAGLDVPLLVVVDQTEAAAVERPGEAPVVDNQTEADHRRPDDLVLPQLVQDVDRLDLVTALDGRRQRIVLGAVPLEGGLGIAVGPGVADIEAVVVQDVVGTAVVDQDVAGMVVVDQDAVGTGVGPDEADHIQVDHSLTVTDERHTVVPSSFAVVGEPTVADTEVVADIQMLAILLAYTEVVHRFLSSLLWLSRWRR